MLSLTLLFAFNLVGAAEIMIKSESSSSFDYQKYMEEHPRKNTYIKHLGDINQKEEALKQKLKRAQFHFLEGSMSEAQQLFQQISKMRWDEDWKKEERKVFIYSLLRTAQLEQSLNHKKKWLFHAAEFDKTFNLQEDLFPPPLVAQYKNILNNLKQNIYPLPQGAQQFDKILVNGQTLIENTSFLKTSSGKKRFSFISNSFKPIVMIGTAEALSKKILPSDPMVTGSCQSPHPQKDFSDIPAYAFFTPQCQLPLRGQLKDLTPQAYYAQNMQSSPHAKQKKSWSKNTWLWIGASVIGAFATYKALESRGSRRSQRTEIQPNNEYISNAQARE